MDSAWAFRSAYEAARKVKVAQDEFCAMAEAGAWDELGELDGLEGGAFPESLQWEALVDVLRGKVKVRSFLIREGAWTDGGNLRSCRCIATRYSDIALAQPERDTEFRFGRRSTSMRSFG